MSKVFAQVFRLAYAADRLLWIFKTLTPKAVITDDGISKGIADL